MTVTLTPGFIEYEGDGSTVDFPIPFNFLDDVEAIDVYNSTNGLNVNDLSTIYVQGTDYNVTGIPTNPAVTFVVAPALGQKIFINRWFEPTQDVQYPLTGKFPAESTGMALDKLTILIQQLLDGILNGIIEFANFMQLVNGVWAGEGYEITNLLPGASGDSAATVAQVVAIFQGGVPAVIGGNAYWTFLGDAVTTDFPLPGSTGHAAQDFQVYIEAEHQTSGGAAPAYTIVPGANAGDPDTLVFGTAPPNGYQIEVYIPSGTAVLTPGVTIVGTGQIADNAITPAKIAPGPEGTFIKTAAGDVTWAALSVFDIGDLVAFLATYPLSSFAAAAAPVNLGGQRIVGLQAGVNPNDAANVGQLLPGKKTKTGIALWTGTVTSWTTTLTFPFNVGQLTVSFQGSTGANSLKYAFHGNTTEIESPTGGLSVTATRTSVPGGTQVLLTTSLGTGGLSGVQNRAFFGAEGDL